MGDQPYDPSEEFENSRGSRLTDHGIEIGAGDTVDVDDYRNSDSAELVEEADDRVVFADVSGHDLNEWASNLGIERSRLSEAMHEQARAVTDYDWGTVDPIVFAR